MGQNIFQLVFPGSGKPLCSSSDVSPFLLLFITSPLQLEAFFSQLKTLGCHNYNAAVLEAVVLQAAYHAGGNVPKLVL